MHFVYVDLCAYGARYRRPTAILSNIPGASGLRRKCPGISDIHVHTPALRRSWDPRSRCLVRTSRTVGALPSALLPALANTLI